MLRGWIILAIAAMAGPAPAQSPLRFQWQPGQVLTYTAEQTIIVVETIPEEGTSPATPAATATKLAVTRTWKVLAVDPAGVATLELTIPAIKQQIARPGPPDRDGKPTIDRTVIDSATPEGRQQMAAFLDKPVVTVRVDSQGRLLEAKGVSTFAERLKVELPFGLILPDSAPAGGGTWTRPLTIRLDPPHGTGETYEATQTFMLKGEENGRAVVGLSTALAAPPNDPNELLPLVPFLVEGEVIFHRATGRYAGAKLTVKREVTNHQGPGSKFLYESQYTETLVEK